MLSRVQRCATATARTCMSQRSPVAVLNAIRRVTYIQKEYELSRAPQSKEEQAVCNLLYNVPKRGGDGPLGPRVLTALLSNEPGVLSRVSGTLAGRGYNIDSLVVCATEVPEISRATIVINETNVHDIIHITRDLEDIVQVWAVLDYSTLGNVLERELLLCKINLDNNSPQEEEAPLFPGGSPLRFEDLAQDLAAAQATRQSLVELTKLFGGKVLDLTNETITVELSAKGSRIDSFLKLVTPYGIAESVRSGPMAMLRGQFSGFEEELDRAEETQEVSAEDLPPG